MKTKLIFFYLFSFVIYLASAQVPQGFNYQAIARDATGNPIVGTSLPVRITIQSDSLGGTVFWKELQSSVTSNNFGLISLVLGKGVKQTGTAATFSAIDWTVTPKFIKTEIYYGSLWKNLGSSRLWAVPYSMIANDLAGTIKKLAVKGTTTSLEEALFEVKNKDGQTIFAVYNEGVRIYVENGSKGTKGGFAVGGFDQTKTWNQEYLRVTADSTRIYINEAAKGSKGGFAVGGFDNTKGIQKDYLNITTDVSGIINPAQNRILWYPLKNAFLTGRVLIESPTNVGENSFATGYESKAKGMYSQAMGYKAIANGNYSTAIGKNAVANDVNSFAFGENSNAKAAQSYAFGNNASSDAVGSYAFGYNAKASGQDAFAIGSGTEASGQGSFAIGFIGRDSANVVTSNTLAQSPWAVAIGMGAQAKAQGAFAIGTQTQATGSYSLALGYKTTASGYYATAMGYKTTAAYSATAMGYQTSASGMHSTALGYLTSTTGVSSLATGSQTKAIQPSSASFGKYTKADGSAAVAMGQNTTAKSVATLVIGRYNDTTVYNSSSYRTWYPADPLFICGNGSADNSRSNAFTIYKSGLADVSGTLRVTNSTTPTSGAGVELLYSSGIGYLYAYDRTGSTYKPLSIYSGLVRPITDNSYTLGSSSYRWTAVYAINGTIQTSDQRMKENITPLSEGLETILNLNPVSFNWKNQTDKGKHIGLIAQEVQVLIPEVVDTGDDPDKTLGINYAGMVPVLVKAIQEQNQQIKSQQRQIDELRILVNKLLSE
jgi:hypothetical protein